MSDLRIVPAGDRALLAELQQVISEEVNDRVSGLAAAVREAAIAGVTEIVPTYCSLLVFYDPSVILYDELAAKLTGLYDNAKASEGGVRRLLEIPCCYGSHFGPDLGDMEKLTGLTREEIIAIHSGTDYRVYMLGFLPGFVYLGGLDKRINAPRLKTPRVAIPKGTVAIGGAQTGVYPLASPGGWRLIGGTPIEFFDSNREEPVLCRAGDIIRFVPVNACDYYDIRQEMLRGTYEIKITEVSNGD